MKRTPRWLILPLLLMFVVSGCSQPLQAQPAADQAQYLKPGDRVAIVGDSITEQRKYTRLMEDYLTACKPELNLWVIQLGWSGEQASGFVGRLDNDLLSFKPTIVTFCYGMNDGRYTAYTEEIGANYRKNMQAIADKLKAAGVRAVLGSPGAVDLDTFKRGVSPEVYNDNLAHLRDIDREIAAAMGFRFANVHDAMMQTMIEAKKGYGKEYHVCGPDGFHPAENGHLVMAYAFLKGLGLDGNLGKITIDMKGSAKASGGHKIVSSQKGSAQVESSRYPFCFLGDPKTPDSTRSIEPYVPFNRDLNRLTLVVNNLDTARAKVTWGEITKSFTREQLAAGINLAAEFLDNPFCENFKQLDAAVARKQAFETTLVKYFNNLGKDVLKELPQDSAAQQAFKTIWDEGKARQEAFAREARSLVKPVTHTLQVTPE